MRKSIRKQIKGKIFSRDDIIRLNNRFFTIFQSTESEHKNYTITLNCDDHETLEFENTDLSVKNLDVLDVKKILHISMIFRDYRNNKSVQLSLSHGSSSWHNDFVVDGNDTSWVDSTDKSFSDIFKAVKPQNHLFEKYKRFLFHLISLNIGYFFIRSFVLVLQKLGYKTVETDSSESNPFIFILDYIVENVPLFKYILIAIISWLVGIWIIFMFWDKIENYLLSLWPSIEFDFGPEHKKTQKNVRKAIGIIFSLILIPIILQIIFSL